MDPITSSERRTHRQLSAAVRETLRELNTQLSVLTHQVSGQLELKDADIGCLDLLSRHGPLSPTALARRAALHPATVTGILDRLERGGWVARDRDPADRRGVVVKIERGRSAEMRRVYSGMNQSMEEICAGYSDTELALIADFLRRTTDAGRGAVEALTSG